MAVLIHRGTGTEKSFNDDESGFHSYAVTDAGVLRVLKQTDTEWIVLFEYSPSGWLDVQGTRYVGAKLDEKPGADGMTKELPKKTTHPVVVL